MGGRWEEMILRVTVLRLYVHQQGREEEKERKKEGKEKGVEGLAGGSQRVICAKPR